MSCSSTGDGGNLCQLGVGIVHSQNLRTSRIGITWKLIRNANSQAPELLRSKLGGRTLQSVLSHALQLIPVLAQVWKPQPRAVIRKLWCTLVSPGECLKLPKLRPQSRPIKSESLGVDEGMSVSGFKSQIRHFQEDIVRRHFKQREDSTKAQKREQLCIVEVKAAVSLKQRVWKQSKGRRHWSSGPARRQSTDSWDLENE